MRTLWIGACSMLLAVAACGSDDVSEGSGGVDRLGDVAAVFAEVDGLDPTDRTKRLEELARAEGGLSLYTSTNTEIAEAAATAFEETHGVDVSVFRADAETIAQRVTEEMGAGRIGADVVSVSGLLLESLDPGGFATYESPQVDDLVEGSHHGHWVADQYDVFVVSWNTETVAGDSVPRRWEDLADPRWQGRLAMEIGDIEWYAGLRQHWTDTGRSEAEIDDLFQAMAANARFVKGHSLMAQLLGSGEFDVAASNFEDHLLRFQGDGAPLAYEPLVEPVIARPRGLAIPAESTNPAAAVLFTDWMLGPGQDFFLAEGSAVTRRDLQPTGRDVLVPDLSELASDLEAWTARYEALAGRGEVIED